MFRQIIEYTSFNFRRNRRYFASLIIATSLIAGCGGGDDEGEAAGGGGGNSAPTISGSPPLQIAADSAYSYTPSVSDADGDTLTFSASNLPSWASINPATGTITGTPGEGDVGIYSNIRISVSDGTVTVSSPAFTVEVVALGTGSALLSWTPPTQNTDGSALLDLNGYRIYWGKSPGNYTKSVSVDEGLTSYMVNGLTTGTWYFAATAVNDAGVESSYSNVASKTIL